MACSKPLTNDEIKGRISNIWTKFVFGVEPERVSDWLVQENVVTVDQWQRIYNNNPTKESRCRGLLHHVFSIPHPRAFIVVRQALVAENHYLLESIDNQELGSGISSLPDIHTALQEAEKTEKHEKEVETDRLLKMQKQHEIQKRAWEEEKDRLLKMQRDLETRLQLDSSSCESLGMVERFVTMDFGAVDLIKKYMKDGLQKIEAELKECSGSIDTSTDEPGFIIRINVPGVAKAEKDFLKLTDSIFMYDHDIDRPGVPAYFYSWPGKEVLRGIQMSHKVSIQLDKTKNRTEPQAVAGDGPEICRVEVRPGKFMILMRGDITKCRVDAIVNAANDDLKHIGGVAAAIAEAAGPELEEDCWYRVKLEGRLLPGQACVTRAGKLPCKKVIHAAGPRRCGGKADEESILAMAVDSSLNVADKERLKSIAMPLISTGLFGFPLDLATDIIVDAVKNYFADNSSTTVREVFFIDDDLQAVASLDKKLKTIQADGSSEKPQGRRPRILKTSVDPQAFKRPLPNQEFYVGTTQRIRKCDGPRQQSEEREERQPHDLSRIIFSIYALSKKAIDDVLRDIEEVIKEYIIDKVLNSPQDQENIAKLNPEQVKRIKDMTDIFPVQIEVDTGRLKRIRIRGPSMEVTSVMDQVHNIFQEAHNK